jgi:hypothetical protein
MHLRRSALTRFRRSAVSIKGRGVPGGYTWYIADSTDDLPSFQGI